MIHKVFSRPHFFNGRLLTAQDLQAEQAYHRDKARFLNLQLYGTGIVSGLHIGLGQDHVSLTISPGYAIDTDGRDICVPCDVTIALPPEPNGLSLWIRYAEAEAAPTPQLPSPLPPDNLLAQTQIDEGFEIELTPIPAGTGRQQPVLSPPSDTSDAWILLGVLLRKRNTWRLKPRRQQAREKAPTPRSASTNRTRR